jgi:opacity protein-like surface antigen
MKSIILAAAVLALTIAGAQAQDAGGMGGGTGGGMGGGRHHGQQKDTKAAPPKPKVDEKAYNSALKEIPNKPYDAWHGVR